MFKEIPLSKKSLIQIKPVFGVGINDSIYMVNPVINGKRIVCPFYRKWKSMLQRCYSSQYQKRCPTYIGCSVFGEWLLLSNFKAWMIKNDWKGKSLDKDLLIQGNKIYSPETCLFVSSEINNLLTDCKASRGEYPQGVSWDKKSKKYKTGCRANGETNYLGLFTSTREAHEAYKIFKYKLIAEIAEQQIEPIRSALLAYKIKS